MLTRFVVANLVSSCYMSRPVPDGLAEVVSAVSWIPCSTCFMSNVFTSLLDKSPGDAGSLKSPVLYFLFMFHLFKFCNTFAEAALHLSLGQEI